MGRFIYPQYLKLFLLFSINTFLNKKSIKIDNNYTYFVQQTSKTNFHMKPSVILVIITEWFIVCLSWWILA